MPKLVSSTEQFETNVEEGVGLDVMDGKAVKDGEGEPVSVLVRLLEKAGGDG